MTAQVFGDAPEGRVDPLSPEHVVTLVRYLASPEAADVSGQVFVVYGPKVMLMAAPTVREVFTATGDQWQPSDLGVELSSFFESADKQSFSAQDLM